MVATLLAELPPAHSAPAALVEKGRVLDNFYVPSRYPNGHPGGAPRSIASPTSSTRYTATNTYTLPWAIGPPRSTRP